MATNNEVPQENPTERSPDRRTETVQPIPDRERQLTTNVTATQLDAARVNAPQPAPAVAPAVVPPSAPNSAPAAAPNTPPQKGLIDAYKDLSPTAQNAVIGSGILSSLGLLWLWGKTKSGAKSVKKGMGYAGEALADGWDATKKGVSGLIMMLARLGVVVGATLGINYYFTKKSAAATPNTPNTTTP